jgi:cephalosporin hydroxylase
MNDREFVRALAEFLALHTEQSSGYLGHLIESFLRGSRGRPRLEPAQKAELAKRLRADMAAQNEVPSFLQNYLLAHLKQDEWPPQAAFIASRFLRRSGQRFVPWRQRQQLIADLDGEPIRGTELGFRQLLYGQGAGPTFRWRGVPCFKSIYDVVIYTMLIGELRPAAIIELGSGTGGSALLFADLCTALGLTTQITSIDTAIVDVPDPRICFVRADCPDWLEVRVKSKGEMRRPCLLIEDFHGDLTGIFKNIDLLLEDGDYFVIEDSSSKQQRIAELIADRPYLIDAKYTDFFGVNCTSAMNSIFIKDTGIAGREMQT